MNNVDHSGFTGFCIMETIVRAFCRLHRNTMLIMITLLREAVRTVATECSLS